MSSPKKIVLKSSDGKHFEVTKAVAEQSMLIKNSIECGMLDNNNYLQIQNVTSDVLEKVLAFCNHRAASAAKDSETFDADFVKVEKEMLRRLFIAADYLEIESLIELIAQTLARQIQGISTKSFRKQFNVKDPLTYNEEDRFLMTYPWAN